MFFFPFRLCAGGLRRHPAAPKGLPNRPNPRLVARIRTEGHQAFDIFRTYISLLGSYLDHDNAKDISHPPSFPAFHRHFKSLPYKLAKVPV